MIRDPRRRAEALASLWARLMPDLWRDVVESGALPAQDEAERGCARQEWECFSLYACVRGLVAAGGFNTETAAAVDHLHDTVVARWQAELGGSEAVAARRSRIAERYAEYGRIGQELEASGAALVSQRLGEAAARHLAAPQSPSAALDEIAASLHEALAEASAEAVRLAME